MNDAPQPQNHALTARAQALAEITKMQSDLVEAHVQIDKLSRELRNQQDRVSLLVEERDRWRSEAKLYNTRLIELATQVSNIGLLTRKAEEIMTTVHELVEVDDTVIDTDKMGHAAEPPIQQIQTGQPRQPIVAPRSIPRNAQS